jgi:hypothetical protein
MLNYISKGNFKRVEYLELHNSIIFQKAIFQLVRFFYFTVFFYTGLSSDFGSLYQSDEVILDATDI